MKRFILLGVFFLIIFILFNNTTNAEFSQSNATAWLTDHISRIWSQAPIEDLSFATIVLKSQQGLTQLNNKMDSQTGCFPKGNCNTKDTALATLALNSMNKPITKQLKYLGDSLKPATSNIQEWNVQIVANEAGSCTIKYDEDPNGIVFNFDEDGELIELSGSWINFDRLTNFAFNKALKEINVNCNFTSSIPKISIIKIIGNTFYIIEEQNSKNAIFKLKNGCYASNPNAICDEASSFYVSWVLKKLNNEITTENYLTSNVDTDLEYSILATINKDQLSSLIAKQEQDGSFDSKVYETSFAYDALEYSSNVNEENKAKTWIESQQTPDGKIGTGIKDTAIALYLVYNAGVTVVDTENEGGASECTIDSDCNIGYSCDFSTGVGLCKLETTQACNQNSICETYLGENSVDCFIDCKCGDNLCDAKENVQTCPQDCTTQEQQTECGNSRCEIGENEINCPLDCEQTTGPGPGEDTCGNNLCDFGEDENNCAIDCQPKKKTSLLWLWIVIFILLIGGIIFFVLTKLKKGKGGEEKPSYLSPRVPPSYSQQPYRAPARKSQRDEGLERELDKSITEAQELLKKKK